MIRLQRSMIAGLTEAFPDLPAVLTALQSAIELEHATIPPYLYALYSLDPAKNAAIADIIESVAIEEMLHMTLAANVLNALGGSPVIDSPDFIPEYPGALPGGVESDLTVHLAPFSMAQLGTFLQIEQPENPLVFESLAASDIITIGEFYTAISTAIGNLGDAAFVTPPRNQIGPDLMEDSVVVSDVASAQAALQVIIEQGEGTSTSPGAVVGGGYAHYYRYMQIKEGHELVPTGHGPNPEDAYAYTGPAITFDTSGVYTVATDPGPYAAGSAQAFANDNFNYTYTALLQAIHRMVNGDASSSQFNTAIGLMMSLKGQAKAMMSGIPNPAVIIGPTFQYQAVNPSVAATSVRELSPS